MTNPCRLPIKPRFVASAIESALGLKPLAKIYDERPLNLDPLQFLEYSLDALGIDIDIDNEALLEDIPQTGPVLIVANHPLGGLEGMAIARVIGRYRPDLQVLTNELLRLIPELAPLFIGVNVLSSDAAAGNGAAKHWRDAAHAVATSPMQRSAAAASTPSGAPPMPR